MKITDENLIKLYEYTEQDQDAEQKNEQLKEYNTQIEKYGGFYISRYEAGITDSMQKNTKEFSSITNDIEGIPVSKQGQIIWNYISLKNAKKNAESMYNNVEIRSDLMSPIQWLNIMQWISNNGYNIKNAEEWGNFSNANFRITGWYSEDYGKTYKYGKDIDVKIRFHIDSYFMNEIDFDPDAINLYDDLYYYNNKYYTMYNKLWDSNIIYKDCEDIVNKGIRIK